MAVSSKNGDAIFQFSHIHLVQPAYVPNSYWIAYDTDDLTNLKNYDNPRYDILPPRKELLAHLKAKRDPIHYCVQNVQQPREAFGMSWRQRINTSMGDYKFNADLDDTEKAKLALRFRITGFISGLLDECLENEWKTIRTAYDTRCVGQQNYPILPNQVFKIISSYSVDHEEYRHLFAPVMDDYKMLRNGIQILPMQSRTWQKWFMNYILKHRLQQKTQRGNHECSKARNATLLERLRIATFGEFSASSQKLWSEWIRDLCVESERNQTNKGVAAFYFKFYQGRLFPNDFRVIFDVFQDNPKMLKILARYPFFCDDSEQWVQRFKNTDLFSQESQSSGRKDDGNKRKWKFLMKSLCKNYHTSTTKQVYKKSIVTFLNQMFAELIQHTKVDECKENESGASMDLLWKNMKYLLSRIVHGSNNPNHKFFYLSTQFDLVLEHNNVEVFEWCVANRFMDPLVLLKRPDYFGRTIDLIRRLTALEAMLRLALFTRFVEWNFQAILHHESSRITAKWMRNETNANNVVRVYSAWIVALLSDAGLNQHRVYADVLRQYADLAGTIDLPE